VALGALTLTVTSGVQGRPFAAAINGLTTGKLEVLNDGSPGFSTVNGKVMSQGLPYPTSTVVLREYEPGVGQGYRDSRIDITAATPAALMAQAIASLDVGRKLARYRVAGNRGSDGSISYTLIVEDDLGASRPFPPDGGSTPTAIAVPPTYPVTPPMTVYRTGSGTASTFTTNYDHAAKKPAYVATIYVDVATGSNSNNGLSSGAKLRSLELAAFLATQISAANGNGPVRILATAGDYLASNTQAGTAGGQVTSIAWKDAWIARSPNCDLVLEVNGAGTVNSIANVLVALPAFVATSDPNIYVSTYTTSAPSRNLWDRSRIDASGAPTGLAQVRTVANLADPSSEINAAWALGIGAMFLDTTNKKMYVRCSDNRVPDSSIQVGSGSVGAGYSSAVTANRTVWVEGWNFWGGNKPFSATATSAFSINLYAKNCQFLFAQGSNGVTFTGGPGLAIYQNCVFSYNDQDGQNPHGATASPSLATSPQVVEIGCTGNWNGWDATGTNNGSTAHEYIPIIRVNGTYLNNADRSVNDINNVVSWNLGCIASSRGASVGTGVTQAATSKTAYCAGFAGTTYAATMYLDACKFGGANDYDLYAGPGCTINYANMDLTGRITGGTGTIQAYAA